MKWISVVTAALWISLPILSQASHSKVKEKSISTTLTRITNGISSQQSNGRNQNISFSDDGRYAVFQSDASNLVSGDTNGVTDVFLYDSNTGTTTRLSNGLSGAEANGQSFDPVISGDGNYVVFVSFANNLVSGDTNGVADVFRVTLSSGTITRLSVDSSGAQSDDASGEPSISNNGNLISFTSHATNLVSSDTNVKEDVFVRNVSAGTTTRVSVSTSGTQGDGNSRQSKISSDGTVVVFASDATNLVSGDTNGCSDIFARVLSSSTTTLVSSSTSGTQGNKGSAYPDLSQDGQYVVFQSAAGNLISSDINGYTDIFMKNRSSGATTLISQTTAGAQVKYDSVLPSISKDGRFVVFESRSPDYVNWDSNTASDVFIRDVTSSLTSPFSTLASNVIGNAKSFNAKISGDGSKIGFTTHSTNLVTTDTNGMPDILTRANPLTGQVVNITPIGDLTESGGAQNAFTVTRYGDTTSSLTVNYTVSGTATAGTDYNTLSGTITIGAGSSTGTIQVTTITDSDVEGNESIIVTISDDSAYIKGGKDSALVNILSTNAFVVSVSATANVATEDGLTRGNFRVSRTGGTLGDLLVNVTIGGTATPRTNYVALPTTVLIPAGQSYTDVAVIGVEDPFATGDQTVVMTIASGSGYTIGSGSSDTVTLKDDDIYQVNIQATDAVLDQSNVSDTGTFRISRSVNGIDSLVVPYALRGTAQNGVEYVTLSGSVTIPSGSMGVDVTVTPISDSSHPGYKSLVVEVLPGSLYTVGPASQATLIIKEDTTLPTVSISTTVATAPENGSSSGNIRISRTGSTSGGLTVAYGIGGTATNGTDYTTLSGSATISSGNSYVDISVTGIEDSLVEGTESVILALQSSSSYVIDPVYSQAEVDILDNETPSVQIFRDSIYSTKNQTAKARARVTRTGNLASALTVNLSYSGTATSGTDYTSPGSTIVIPAGAASVTFDVAAITGTTITGNKLLNISIGSSGSYSIGTTNSTQVVIVDGTFKVFADLLVIAPNADVQSVSISDNGRYVAFASAASNLVSGDNNGASDIFVVDTTAKTISRVMALGGAEPNGNSRNPVISADGRYVAFSSQATNFFFNDVNNHEDVFLADRTLGTVTYVSKGFSIISEGGDSLNPQISSGGDYVVFESKANNLVWNDSNALSDIFIWSRVTGLVDRVSLKSDSSQLSYDSYRPSVSADGNLVAFESKEKLSGDNDYVTDILLKNRQTGSLVRVSAPASAFGGVNDGPSTGARVSSDGSAVIYQSSSANIVASDTNAVADIFRYRVSDQQNEIVSQTADGWLGNRSSVGPSVETNGDLALFITNSRNMGGGFNCTTSAYVKSVSQKTIMPIENGSIATCSSPVKEASMSFSGGFVASVIASSAGLREIMISANPLK